MKKLAIVFLVMFLSACGSDVTPAMILQAQKACKSHHGVQIMHVNTNIRGGNSVGCKDGTYVLDYSGIKLTKGDFE